MVIYLAQHGLAYTKEENEERPLTSVGVKECESVSKFLKNKGFILNKIFHSDKLRSKESAKIYSTILSNGDIYEIENLSPNDPVEKLCENFCEDSLYVGHLPHLEKLISFLITGSEEYDLLRMKNSGVVCLEKRESSFFIKWYVTPEII
jgi:phosphohistidine phosphatase